MVEQVHIAACKLVATEELDRWEVQVVQERAAVMEVRIILAEVGEAVHQH